MVIDMYGRTPIPAYVARLLNMQDIAALRAISKKPEFEQMIVDARWEEANCANSYLRRNILAVALQAEVDRQRIDEAERDHVCTQETTHGQCKRRGTARLLDGDNWWRLMCPDHAIRFLGGRTGEHERPETEDLDVIDSCP